MSKQTQPTQTLATLDTTSATVVLGPNMRLTSRETVEKDTAFIESVRDQGVLSPVLAYQDANTVVIYAGQRRFHAAAITGQPLPAIVRDQAPEDLDRLTGQWDENERRTAMSDADRVTGIEQMALLGISAEQIAQSTKIAPEAVEAALRVAKSTQRHTIAQENLSLDQAHGLVEFEDNPEAREELLASLNADRASDGFDHVLAQLRQDRDSAAARENAVVDLTQRGVTVLDDYPDYDARAQRVEALADAASGERVDVAAHESCPGHAVYVEVRRDWSGDGQMVARSIAYCQDPKKNGHRDRYSTNGSTAAGPMSEEDKATRKEVIANNKAWDAATAVRREWLAKFVQRKTPPTGAEALTAAAITGSRARGVTAALAGGPPRATDQISGSHPPTHPTNVPGQYT